MHFLQAINSDISVLRVCNKTGGTIKRRYKKKRELEKSFTTNVQILYAKGSFSMPNS